MKQFPTPRPPTTFAFPPPRTCPRYMIQLNLSDPSGLPLQQKQNHEPHHQKLVPSIKPKTTDRAAILQSCTSKQKFKDFLRQVDFFNIKQFPLEMKIKKKRITTSAMATTAEPVKVYDSFRKSLNLRKSSMREGKDTIAIRTQQSDNNSGFERRLKEYHDDIKRTWQLNGMVREIPGNYQQAPKYTIRPGNNSKMIKNIMRKRWWWVPEEDMRESQFVWAQLKEKSMFYKPEFVNKIHNHFEGNTQLGSKKSLFLNLQSYYASVNDDVFNHLPLTFHIISPSDPSYCSFLAHYHTHTSALWILKPGEYTNRGHGITLHNNLTTIHSTICTPSFHPDGRPKTYILQQYLQRPFLYNRRKFDIRCYIVITSLNGKIKGYWYKEGYIRTSSKDFELKNFSEDIHLTNDAVQKKYEDGYGKYEKGNKLSFYEFKKYLQIRYPGRYNFLALYNQMKQVARCSILSTYRSLCQTRHHNLFQIFGLDFMIDQTFRPWLIEINTNPCLETTCPVLERVIPGLIEETFRVCVDTIYPPPREWPGSRRCELGDGGRRGMELIFDQEGKVLEQKEQRPDRPKTEPVTKREKGRRF